MRAIFALLGLSSATLAISAEDKSVFGTHWVQYQPIQVGGALKGCQLVFMAVTADRAYQGGDWIAVNGSIVLRDTNSGPAGIVLTLKIGLKNLTTPSVPEFVPPHFAYLQTANSSTAKAPQVTVDGDPGYKLFTYRGAEPSVASVLKDIAVSPKLTIGYNRAAGGMDVLVPVDLMIVDSEYTASQEVIRKSSPEVSGKWAQCATNVIESVIGKK